MEVVVTTGAIRLAKLQSNRHHQQTNTQFSYRPDALPVAQPTVSAYLQLSPCITTSIILSTNSIQNGDILVPAHPECPGKSPVNECRCRLPRVK